MSSNISELKFNRIDVNLLEQGMDLIAHKEVAIKKQGLEDVYNLTKTSVYGLALSILKSPQDAEDVLQDTYINLYRGINSYKSEGKPMAFIFTIARNLALIKIRKNKNISDIPEETWDKFIAKNENLNIEDKIVLNNYLSNLSEQEREIVMLFAIADFKHREISEMLNLPLSTVISKYSRSIKKLRDIHENQKIKEQEA